MYVCVVHVGIFFDLFFFPTSVSIGLISIFSTTSLFRFVSISIVEFPGINNSIIGSMVSSFLFLGLGFVLQFLEWADRDALFLAW